MGKLSEDGSPPPSDKRPGFFRRVAAFFRTHGFRAIARGLEDLGFC